MIGRRTLLYFLSRIISGVLAYVGLFFISRYLGPDVYGTIAWAMAFVATFNSISDLGFNSAHIKRVSEGKDIDDCLSSYIVIKLVLTGILIAFLLAVVGVWYYVTGEEIIQSQLQIIFLFIAYQVFYDIAMIATMTFDAQLETAKTQISMLMDPLIRVPLIIFVSVNGLRDIDLAYAYVIGATTVAIVGLFFLSRDHYKWKKPTMFRSYAQFAIPLAIVVIITTLAANIDKITIGIFWTDAEVGYYAICQTILNIFAMLGIAVSTLTFPTFSKMYTDGDIEAVRKNTLFAERYISMLILPVVTLIILFPTEISIILFGGDFAESGGPMRFLAVSLFLNVLNLMYISHINAVNRPDITAKLTLLSLIVNLGLLLVLVPAYLGDFELFGLAATGAAIANMISFFALFISTRTTIFKLTGTMPNKRLLLHLLASVVTGISILGLNLLLPMSNWLTMIIYGFVSLAVFYSSLAVLGELTKEDLNYFLAILRPDKMKDYLVSELKKKE